MLSPKKITHGKSWKNGYSEAEEFRAPTDFDCCCESFGRFHDVVVTLIWL